MTKTDLRTRLAAIVCTLLVSTTCLVGAVGPATANGQSAPVAAPLTDGRIA